MPSAGTTLLFVLSLPNEWILDPQLNVGTLMGYHLTY